MIKIEVLTCLFLYHCTNNDLGNS